MRLALGLLALTAIAGERKSIFPPGVKPVGPYSPGVQVGDFLYISGQGARDAAGKLPAGVDAQTKQCLENVKTIIEAGGLKMENIVYTQVYLSDMANYEAMNRVYESYFSKDKPARAIIGVKRMPTDTPVEISAVATTNAGKRVYLPGILGHRAITNHVPSDYKAEARQAFDEAELYLETKKLTLSDLAFANIYFTAGMPADFVKTLADKYMKTVVLLPVNSLPLGANIEITGIAGQPDVYSVHTGTTQQVLEAIQKDLKTAGLTMENIVVSNVYIDDIDNFATMNKTYASFFTKAPPTRTTVQPVTGARSNTISVIAIK